MKQGYFVTGTDGRVGKTLVSCALLRIFAQLGKSTAGMKPVAVGHDPDGRGPDYEEIEALQMASSVTVPPALMNPYTLRDSTTPYIAAQGAGSRIDPAYIVRAYQALQPLADVLIIEGARKFQVPLTDRYDTADLAQQLDLPIILVVGVRAGCLNHALLTAQAIQNYGLRLAGWVANEIDSAMACSNRMAWEERLKAPLLGIIPYDSALRYDNVVPLLDITRLGHPGPPTAQQVVNIKSFTPGGWVDS